MEESCKNEVIELHKFFEQWFKAEIENSSEFFARFESVISKEFLLIMPTGKTTTREEIIKQIRNGYGSRKDDEVPYRLWVKDIQCRMIEGNLCLVTYEEWGEIRSKINARLSSALFRKKNGTANSVEWVHVHEVYIPTN